MGLLDDAFISLPKIAKGMITAPETPGHGLAFKPEVLKDFVVR
jgi:L-alanine-DL-glutamate epimerase-like enolase superfamily enzyme